jgi:hypothetical protein
MSWPHEGAEPGVTAAPQPEQMSIILPAAWKVIDLDPATRDRSLKRLIRQAVGSADSLAMYRRWAERAYRSMITEAAESGAFFAATYDEQVAGRPLSASVLVFIGRLPLDDRGSPLTVEEMARILAEPGAGETTVEPPTVVELGMGTATRSRVRMTSEVPDSDRTVPVDLTRFFLPRADWDRLLVMAFSTAILPASDALAELFDQIALGARWRD